MKTIGFPLYQSIPTTEQTDSLQRACQHYRGTAIIKINDVELDPLDPELGHALAQYEGQFVQIITDGPDEASLASTIHQQLVAKKFCY